MPKFYITDGSNTFLIDTNTHLQACRQACKHWQDKQQAIGKFICFSNNGFPSLDDNNCIETKIIKGLDFSDD